MGKMTLEKRKRRENRQVQNIKQDYDQTINDLKILSEKLINKNIPDIDNFKLDLKTFIDNYSRIKNSNFNEQKSLLNTAKDMKNSMLLIDNYIEEQYYYNSSSI